MKEIIIVGIGMFCWISMGFGTRELLKQSRNKIFIEFFG